MLNGLDKVWNNDQDLTILYQGGSAGFLFYYLTLLNGNYISGDDTLLKSNNLLEDVNIQVYQQFNYDLIKNNPKYWKQLEFWPDNKKVKYSSVPSKKLFLICNPLFNKSCLLDNLKISMGTNKVLLYVDINTHVRLAYDKLAYWFTEESRKTFNAPSRDFSYIKKILKEYETFEQMKVDPVIPQIIKMFKPTPVYLPDLIKFNKFNFDQQRLIQHWLSIQPHKTLRCLNTLL